MDDDNTWAGTRYCENWLCDNEAVAQVQGHSRKRWLCACCLEAFKDGYAVGEKDGKAEKKSRKKTKQTQLDKWAESVDLPQESA